MKKDKIEKNTNAQTVCNACGKLLACTGDMYKEAVFCADFSWGYFSDKDGRHDCWRLCEACYDKLTSSFKIPVETYEKTVLMDE
jgi:hypothetical protein